MTRELITTARAAMEGTTPGPWKTGQSMWNDDGEVLYALHGITRACYADCMFIAASRDLVPDLTAALEAALDKIDRIKKPGYTDANGDRHE